MSFSAADFDLLTALAPEASHLWVLDLRQSPPQLYSLHRRACYHNGFLMQTEDYKPELLPLRRADVLVMLGEDPESLRNVYQNLQAHHPDLPRTQRIHCQAGQYLLAGQAIPPADAQACSRSTQVRFSGLGPDQHWREQDLPLRFSVQVPERASLRCFEISGHNDFMTLPPASWFRLPPALPVGPLELLLELQPEPDGDQWLLSYGPERRPVPRLTQAPAGLDWLRQQQRLAIVFDRTCPDPELWTAASRLLSQQGRILPEDLPPAAEAIQHPVELNRKLRQTLGQALQNSLQTLYPELQQTLRLELAWFADRHEPNLAQPEGLTLPLQDAGLRLPVDLAGLPDALNDCGYSPGLDLFDPLEQALQLLLESFRQHDSWCPVLVIGNSPPNPPERHPDSPFEALLRKSHSTLRRPWQHGSGQSFTECLQALEQQGVPVIYLFIHGHQPLAHDRHGQRLFDAFMNYQRETESLLRHYLPVHTCTLEQLPRRLPELLQNLLAPVRSGVKFLERTA